MSLLDKKKRYKNRRYLLSLYSISVDTVNENGASRLTIQS